MKEYDLYIFDIDGTLCDRDSVELYPQAAKWFAGHSDKRVALATNQGGVGLRYWMELEGFGNPDEMDLPTEQYVNERLASIYLSVEEFVIEPVIYRSFRYKSKKTGIWGPGKDSVEWLKEFRKPSPDMLLAAMNDARINNAIMIGDRDEDKLAASAAGIDFCWADEFWINNE